MRRLALWAAAVAVVAVALAGCGGGGHGGHEGAAAGGFGRPGKASGGTRTVEVRMLDTLRFDPSDVTVGKGETVTFRIVNAGKIMHEFDLGDEKYQSDHEKEMRDMGSEHHMGDQPNAVSVEPGETKTITWTFSEAGTGIYGCHVEGHYAGGMKGTVTVS